MVSLVANICIDVLLIYGIYQIDDRSMFFIYYAFLKSSKQFSLSSSVEEVLELINTFFDKINRFYNTKV
jgi:hypothetical protein